MSVREWLDGRLVGLALGGLALLGCTRPNPAFDGVIIGEASETSSSTSAPGTESSTSVSETTGPSETSTTGPMESSESGSEETETEATSESDTDEPLCEAPALYLDCDAGNQGLTELPWRALGLGCEGGPGETIPLAEEPLFVAADTASWRVAKAFGIAPGPNHGGKLWAAREQQVVSGGEGQPEVPPNTSSAMLMLSTASLPVPNSNGEVIVVVPGSQAVGGQNANPDSLDPPEPINPGLGSNGGAGGTPFVDCVAGLDCSDSLYGPWVENSYADFYDKIWMRFTVEAPEGVHSFVLDLALFSTEFPEFIDLGQYADTLVVWASSDSFTGNLAIVGGEPLSATSLAEAGAIDFEGLDAGLAGTGFENHGASSWMVLVGPAEPFEAVELTIFFADLGDASRASVALLDNFRWRCGGCGPGECGLML